ncbi:MAG: M28 family peptidase [Gemmatimonadales bacterium]|jgi:Zn-dependent M28 family amino/carboxypeptidase|nr:M28 family peptidase [Gemmatimonadales bacterium]
MRHLVALLAATLLVAPAGHAQARDASRAAAALDAGTYRAHLAFLADDALEGRAPATRGGVLAAKYVAAQFERLGLEPAGDDGGWFHRIPVVQLAGTPELRTSAGEPLRFRDDFVLWSMRDTAEVMLAAPLVFVGYGITAPEATWDDFAGTDVRGKVLVVLVNDPGLQDPALFRGKELTYYGRWTYKLEEAERRGAAAILLVHTTESATYPWSTVVGSWSGPQVRLARGTGGPLLAAGWLTEDAARRIVSAGGHELDDLVRRAARPGFRAIPLGDLTASARVRSTVTHSETMNVLGRLPGRGPRAHEAVLVGGHYDHLGIGVPVRNDSIYNGALDNASGTAGVLALAEALVQSGVQPGRSLLFMAFGAEESGLIGSQAFAARPTLPLRDLVAMLNLDVLNLLGRTRDIGALGRDQSSLGAVFEAAARAEGLRVADDPEARLRGSFFRSDHFPLVRVGVPALSLEGGLDYVDRPAGWGKVQQERYTAERYHQPQDELLPDYTPEGALQQLRVVLRVALAVAEAPDQPIWHANSEFAAAGRARVSPKGPSR